MIVAMSRISSVSVYGRRYDQSDHLTRTVLRAVPTFFCPDLIDRNSICVDIAYYGMRKKPPRE
jgi:hypothetical protein